MHDLRSLLVANEPDGIAPYIARLQSGRRYHHGTTAEVLGGFVRRESGLWIPSGSKVDSVPLDLLRTYILLSQISDGGRIGMGYIERTLRQVPLKESLMAVTACMRVINAPGEGSLEKLDRDSLNFFTEPYRSRLEQLMKSGSVLHAPQLLMILAKLIIAICPDEVAEGEHGGAYLPVLLLVLADNLESTSASRPEGKVPLFGDLSLEISANHMFNASVEPDFSMASFQRRWIEMPGEELSRYSAKALVDTYREATGVSLLDQATVMMIVYTNCTEGCDISRATSTFSALGWTGERLDSVLKNLALSIDEYRRAVRAELADHGLDWYFTTFARYPLVRFGDELVLLDPSLLLKRCLGYLPFFDAKEALDAAGRRQELSEFRRAFNDYSERLALEAFGSMVGNDGGRVFGERALKAAFPKSKTADFAVDYGDAWVIVEVTTSQVSRDTVNAACLRGLEQDRDLVVEEAMQVASTIDNLRLDSGRLVMAREIQCRYYPIVVVTEGFPNHPAMQALVRDHLRDKGILQKPDTAPIELLSLQDLDFIEGAMENSGVSFPDILKAKATSNFWADSIRNFVVSDSHFTVSRPRRVDQAVRRFFVGIGREFGEVAEVGDL